MKAKKKTRRATSEMGAALSLAGYAPLLAQLRERVRASQLRAAQAASAEMMGMYWQIGHLIIQVQRQEGWGQGVIPRLAADLHAEFPQLKGFSERNLKYMVRFAAEYGRPSIVQQAVAQLESSSILSQRLAEPTSVEIVQQPVARAPRREEADRGGAMEDPPGGFAAEKSTRDPAECKGAGARAVEKLTNPYSDYGDL